MIRVIHYLPSLNCTSGIANLIMNYYRNIDKNKIQFHFIYFSKLTENNFKKEIEKLGGTTNYICPPNNLKEFNKKFDESLHKFKMKYKNDSIIFHNHQLAFTIFQYRLLKKNEIYNIIVHNHMTKFSDNIIKALRNMILFLPISLLKVNYFACSNDACKLISRYNFVKKNRIYIMKNGIDCNKFKFNNDLRNKFRRQLKIENNYVIGNIGHFETVKNHRFLIRLFYKKYNRDNYKLLLVGNGSKKNKILKLIKKYNIENKTIILENRNDIPNILFSMDCFVFPSRFEGLGIAAIEAQASGLPVVMSKHVPSEVIIKNCIKKKNYNMYSWTETINAFMKQKIDRLSINQYIVNSKYNIENNIKDLENKYENIVKRGM